MNPSSDIPKTTRRSVVIRLCLLALAFNFATSAWAANEYWAGSGGTTNTPVAGTWTTTTPTVWSDGTSATPNIGWTAGNAAVFGGTDPQSIGIAVGGAISASSLTFLNSGYIFTNSAAETITTTGNPFFATASGTSNTIGNNVKITTASASASVGASGGANGGTIVVAQGGTLTSAKALTIQGAGTLVEANTGGTVSTPNATGAYLAIGGATGDSATLLVNGGAVAVNRSSGSIWICGGPAPVTGSTGTLTITSGTVTETGGFVTIGYGSGDVGTLNLNGGTLSTENINGGGTGGSSGSGTGIANFNGGTLTAFKAEPLYMTGITTANVRNGGALINNNGFAITIGQALLHSSIGGDNATDGGLTSSGSGTLTLTGANTYNGPTTVSAGHLVTTSGSTGGGAYTVADRASLEVQINTAGTSLTAGTLTLGTSGSLTNTFTLNGNASATVPAVVVNGALALNGTVTVNVNGTLSGPGTNLLLSYGSISGAGSFVAGSLPSVSGYVALLVNDTVNKQLKLIYLPPSLPVQWATTSGNWDTTSLNWQPLGGGSPTNYYELSPVTFDDTAPFAATRTVTLTGNRNPASITVNTANNYVLAGSFAMAGGGAVTMSGGGTLVLGVNNGLSGGTTINSGTVQVGNSGTAGSLGSGAVVDNGSLVFDLNGNSSMANVISGTGSLMNNGAGSVTLSATNLYSGATMANAGTLTVLSANTGNGDYTVADGATLGVVAAGSTSTLQVNNLTYGTSGSVTNNFNLGSGRLGIYPLIYSTAALNLNGTVTVNVTGNGLSAGTYILLQYSGTPAGSGKFVAGALPGISVITNDTTAQQLELIVTTPGLVWDSGNTNNGGIIDPASGTWDLNPANLVWNNAGANVPFSNGNSAIFAGADGNYNINVAAAISAPTVTFVNSGYDLTSVTNQIIALGTTSTAIPKLVVAGGKTATIGTNVTVNLSNTSFIGNSGNTPGGTLIIANGGVLQELTANTWAVDGGPGTAISIQTGGLMQDVGGSTGQLAIGATAGNSPTVSVDGGSLAINGNGTGLNILKGTLTLNAGSVTLPAGTTKPVNLGSATGFAGTLNLNGGVFSAAGIAKGDPSAFTTNNFNGGTLRAVNTNFASTFLTGLDCANVRNGGAIIDDGGFSITISQPLLHSTIPGDNAVDGGLVKIDSGTLTLTNTDTYNGLTTVSNGTLLVDGSISSNALVEAGATLGGDGTIGGSVTVAVGGTLAPGTTNADALTISGNLTIQGNAQFVVNKSLVPSNNLCVVGGSLVNSGAGLLTVTNLGPALQLGDSFQLFNKAIANGGALSIVPAPGSGLAWTNMLASNGSVAVIAAPAIPSSPTNITFAVNGNTLTLSWPGSYLGWIAQSNSINLANTNFWFDIAGSASVTNINVTVNPALTNVFYRLRHP